LKGIRKESCCCVGCIREKSKKWVVLKTWPKQLLMRTRARAAKK
jgi:hypothetical protein